MKLKNVKILNQRDLMLIDGGGPIWKWLGRVCGDICDALEYAGKVHVEQSQELLPYNGN